MWGALEIPVGNLVFCPLLIGQSLVRAEQGTGMIWLTVEKAACDCVCVACRASMEAARSVRRLMRGPEGEMLVAKLQGHTWELGFC